MRRYMQGTLDFACGIYAVINAISCTHGIDLAGARRIYRETVAALSGTQGAEAADGSGSAHWNAFLCNQTDHYWLVHWMLGRWCLDQPWRMDMGQPFSPAWAPCGGLGPGPAQTRMSGEGSVLPPQTREQGQPGGSLYLPERHEPGGPVDGQASADEARACWDVLERWFREREAGKPRAALLRFHRFISGTRHPVVSHWTTACGVTAKAVVLHDASAEPGSLFALERQSLLHPARRQAPLRIVPESIVLLEARLNPR